MIWFDLVTPKSVLFFEPIIKEIEKHHKVLVTSRGDDSYVEVNNLLDLKNIRYNSFGEYGGSDLKDKLSQALRRQNQLNEFIQNYEISQLVNLCSVDGCRVAFGNNIKIVNFCDFPTGKDDILTHVAKLTLPLSYKIIYPFYIPQEIFKNYCDNLYEYDFLDPIIYLQNQTKDKNYFNSLNIDKNKKTICFREEEFKSSYVLQNHMSFVYETLLNLDVNLIIIPRYEAENLKKIFKKAIVLPEKKELSNILPFCDLFVGGGGTINIEAVYWNIPTISTRSFLAFYDRYLIDKGYMNHAKNQKELELLIEGLLNKENNSSLKKEVDIVKLVKEVLI